MDDLVYFTRRASGKGSLMAWVYRGKCPSCKKGTMGKPKDPKTGKVKTRSKEYVCDSCGHEVEKQAYEETLTCEVKYDCPHCNKEGEAEIPFKRKKVQVMDEEKGKKVGVDAIKFNCSHCDGQILIVKKMKK